MGSFTTNPRVKSWLHSNLPVICYNSYQKPTWLKLTEQHPVQCYWSSTSNLFNNQWYVNLQIPFQVWPERSQTPLWIHRSTTFCGTCVWSVNSTWLVLVKLLDARFIVRHYYDIRHERITKITKSDFSVFLLFQLSRALLHIYTHIDYSDRSILYIYIYVCVCVCVSSKCQLEPDHHFFF